MGLPSKTKVGLFLPLHFLLLSVSLAKKKKNTTTCMLSLVIKKYVVRKRYFIKKMLVIFFGHRLIINKIYKYFIKKT